MIELIKKALVKLLAKLPFVPRSIANNKDEAVDLLMELAQLKMKANPTKQEIKRMGRISARLRTFTH